MVRKNNTVNQPNVPAQQAPGAIRVCVRDGLNPLRSGLVSLYRAGYLDNCCDFNAKQWNESRNECEFVVDNGGVLENGCYVFSALVPSVYVVGFDHDVENSVQCVEVHGGCTAEVCFDLGINASVTNTVIDRDCKELPCAVPRTGDTVQALVQGYLLSTYRYTAPSNYIQTGDWTAQTRVAGPGKRQDIGTLSIPSTRPGGPDAILSMRHEFEGEDPQALPVTGNLTVSHKRRIAEPDGPMSFFVRLLDSSKSIGFGAYRDFIDQVFHCKDREGLDPKKPCYDKLAGDSSKLRRLERELTDHGVGAYELLRTATEAFLLFRCCVRPCPPEDRGWPLNYQTNPDLGDYRKLASVDWQELFCKYLGNQRLPYIQRVIDTAFPEYGISERPLDQRFCADVLLRSRVDNPCFMELIWNYWHEEGMLVQSINAVSRRFQNLRAPGVRDPLAHMEIDPLRPLNNIL